MFKWIRKSTLDPLAVSMSGVKLADRLLVIGCSDPSLIAALGAKVGLTGRACAVDEDPSLVASAAQIAEREGVLIESAPAPGLKVPYPDESFDVAGGLVPAPRRYPGVGGEEAPDRAAFESEVQ